MDEVAQQLPSSIYLTIDLDGLDPSVIPGTGTPEPGGLTYRQLIKLIQALGGQKKIVAADITEMMKIPGSLVSEYTAAKIASQIFIQALACAR
jgi:agmatinase